MSKYFLNKIELDKIESSEDFLYKSIFMCFIVIGVNVFGQVWLGKFVIGVYFIWIRSFEFIVMYTFRLLLVLYY